MPSGAWLDPRAMQTSSKDWLVGSLSEVEKFCSSCNALFNAKKGCLVPLINNWAKNDSPWYTMASRGELGSTLEVQPIKEGKPKGLDDF